MMTTQDVTIEQQPTPMLQVLPMNIGVTQANGHDGNPVVVLQISTPYGQFLFPMDGQTARTVGVQLQQTGSAAASGLILAR